MVREWLHQTLVLCTEGIRSNSVYIWVTICPLILHQLEIEHLCPMKETNSWCLGIDKSRCGPRSHGFTQLQGYLISGPTLSQMLDEQSILYAIFW